MIPILKMLEVNKECVHGAWYLTRTIHSTSSDWDESDLFDTWNKQQVITKSLPDGLVGVLPSSATINTYQVRLMREFKSHHGEIYW